MESVKNYCTELMEHLERSGSSSKKYQVLRDGIARSVKFNLPDDGAVLPVRDFKGDITDFVRKYVPLGVRLPYDVITLQLDIREPGDVTPVVIIAAKEEASDDAILILPAFKRRGVWDTCKYTWRLFKDGTSSIGQENGTEYPNDVYLVSSVFLTPVIMLVAALACSNVEVADNPPPAKLNAKRAKKGKVPFFEYKTLVLGGAGRSSSGDGGGTHASPRVHLRRGHIRRLADKTVWVNSCVVGNKSIGMIHKDYELRAPE